VQRREHGPRLGNVQHLCVPFQRPDDGLGERRLLPLATLPEYGHATVRERHVTPANPVAPLAVLRRREKLRPTQARIRNDVHERLFAAPLVRFEPGALFGLPRLALRVAPVGVGDLDRAERVERLGDAPVNELRDQVAVDRLPRLLVAGSAAVVPGSGSSASDSRA